MISPFIIEGIDQAKDKAWHIHKERGKNAISSKKQVPGVIPGTYRHIHDDPVFHVHTLAIQIMHSLRLPRSRQHPSLRVRGAFAFSTCFGPVAFLYRIRFGGINPAFSRYTRSCCL